MAEYEIRCVIRGKHSVIKYVGIGNELFPIEDIVVRHKEKKDTFHTYENGVRVRVYPNINPYYGHWFLTTYPDGILDGNFGHLPECDFISS